MRLARHETSHTSAFGSARLIFLLAGAAFVRDDTWTQGVTLAVRLDWRQVSCDGLPRVRSGSPPVKSNTSSEAFEERGPSTAEVRALRLFDGLHDQGTFILGATGHIETW